MIAIFKRAFLRMSDAWRVGSDHGTEGTIPAAMMPLDLAGHSLFRR